MKEKDITNQRYKKEKNQQYLWINSLIILYAFLMCTLMAESEEELKSLLMKVKVESEKVS